MNKIIIIIVTLFSCKSDSYTLEELNSKANILINNQEDDEDIKKAIKILEIILKQDGNNKGAYTNLCNAYMIDKNYESAANTLEKYLNIDSDDVIVKGLLSNLYLCIGKKSKANVLFNELNLFYSELQNINEYQTVNWAQILILSDKKNKAKDLINKKIEDSAAHSYYLEMLFDNQDKMGLTPCSASD